VFEVLQGGPKRSKAAAGAALAQLVEHRIRNDGVCSALRIKLEVP
jgi:hypothetical protein